MITDLDWRARRQTRLDLGVTQRRLAILIGVGTDTLMRWESGGAPSKLGERVWAEELTKLAQA